jgi:hypothetical protein
VVGVGDAENDHAFLQLCECGVAVANALPMLKEQADIVTQSDCGAGVEELIEQLVSTDLQSGEARLTRHHILLGSRVDGQEERLSPYGVNLLLAGASGGGKYTLALGLLERLTERRYQCCVIDPEGDYETFEEAIVLGNAQRAPMVEEVLQLLESSKNNVVINLVGLALTERPEFFHALFPRLQEWRARTGRPHWIVVDETHHVLSGKWEPAAMALSQRLTNLIFITVHPRLLAPAVLAAVHCCITVGQAPEETLHEFSEAVGQRLPLATVPGDEPGEALVWWRRPERAPYRLRPAPNRTQRQRHRRKYAEGELGPDRSFYFRGPEGKLNLRAQNLLMFQQLAEGVDEETWCYHLRGGDYSRWFRDAIKDEALAAATESIERASQMTLQESRARIKAAIAERYTLPSETPVGG